MLWNCEEYSPGTRLWYRHFCRMRCVIAAPTTDTGGLPVLIFRQLFDPQSSTYSYLLADGDTSEAVLIDSVFEQAPRD